MNIWGYDRATGALLGQSVADPDPEREGHWLIPAFATSIRPPFVPPGCVAVFDGGLSGEGSWQLELEDVGHTRQRLLKHVAGISETIDDYCGDTGMDRDDAIQLVLDAAGDIVERIGGVALRESAISSLKDMLASYRPN